MSELNGFEAVIGLEVHLHLKTESKMFCGCRANYFGSEPNLSTCPVCLGLPGSLPVINRQAVEHGIMLALALDCEVSRRIQFYRKNYFYPDLPKNYQITGQNSPVGENGTLDVGGRQIHIHQVHLEEDAGKSVHPGARSVSLVDLNRAGVPLTELVTEPDITSPQEARDFLSKLRTIAQTLGISTANPEEGAMRADVNVSVRPKGQKELGVKVEIKNLNSFRSVQRALEYEIDRQIKVLGTGGRLGQETRSWDDDRGTTETMRSKEFAHDYRYFPDPDLVPLEIDQAWIDSVRAKSPELPDAKRRRYVQVGLREYDARIIADSLSLAQFFDAAAQLTADLQGVANWLLGDISMYLNERALEISQTKLTPQHLVGLLDLINRGTISGKIAKEILPLVLEGADPAAIVKERGLTQIGDAAELEAVVQRIIAENPEPAANYRAGKAGSINFLLGKAMQATKGRAKPELVRALLEKQLK